MMRYRLVYRLITLLIVLLMPALVAAPAIAAVGDPNGASNRPQPGWSLWLTRSQAAQANFNAGFSNSEYGGLLDFQAACQAAGAGEAANQWVRLTNSVARIGTGRAEYGCWQNGRFAHTYSLSAIVNNQTVNCLTVRAIGSNGLNIRAEPSTRSRILRTVRNGSRLTPSAFPAIIRTNEGRNWVEIQAPLRGWVSDDRPTSAGNLTRCDTVPGALRDR
jgi:Bacterial SH3 domain